MFRIQKSSILEYVYFWSILRIIQCMRAFRIWDLTENTNTEKMDTFWMLKILNSENWLKVHIHFSSVSQFGPLIVIRTCNRHLDPNPERSPRGALRDAHGNRDRARALAWNRVCGAIGSVFSAGRGFGAALKVFAWFLSSFAFYLGTMYIDLPFTLARSSTI